MSKKQPRKVALINVFDYPRSRYSAYWIITVTGDDAEGYKWHAALFSCDQPVAWNWQGKVLPERPDVPWPKYPADVPVKQHEFERMSAASKAKVIAAQDERRRQCAEIYEAHPKPVYLLEEEMGLFTPQDVGSVEDVGRAMRDEADRAAQEWVLERIGHYKRPETPPSRQEGHSLVITPVGMALDVLLSGLAQVVGRAARRLFGPLLMAMGLNVTVRNSMLNQIRDAIDAGAGAGLVRIYDGSRPATCGTATTLGAELTCSDPCAAAAASGVLTFSAIAPDTAANASITATWGRFVDSTGTCVGDYAVGTSGSDLNLNSTTITINQEVSISSAQISAGNA